MEARNLAAVGLSLMLAANCFMPCYTLAYADEPQEVADVPQEEQEEVPGSSGRSELPSGDGESITDAADGGAAAEGHGPDDGATEGAIEDIAADYGGLVLTSDLPLYNVRAASASTVVGQTWGSVKDTVSTTWNLVKDYLQWFYGNDSWLTQVSTVERAKIIPQFTLMNVIKQQWGYNYGTGGTIVWAKNSPAGWLNSLYLDLSSLNSFLRSQIDGGYFTTWIYYIYDNGLKMREQNDRLYDFLHSQYDGRYFTTTVGYIYNALVANGNLASKGFDDIYKFLTSKIGDGYFTTWIYYIYDNGLKMREQNDRLYSFLSSQYDGRYFTTTLGYIYDAISTLESPLSNFDSKFDKVISALGLLNDSIHTLDMIEGLLATWGDRWDSEYYIVIEWGKAWEAYRDDLFTKLDDLGSIGNSWSDSDKSFLFAKLDGISDHLSVEAGQTILDAILGEVKPQYINDQLTIVKEVARNRFPFCIPAMMQQMLGLMQSEAQVPHWEFDFFGSPLVLDLGDLEGFASVTRWASCFMLFLALLANTKRFIFDLGGGGK